MVNPKEITTSPPVGETVSQPEGSKFKMEKVKEFFTKAGTCEFNAGELAETAFNCNVKYIFKISILSIGMIAIIGWILDWLIFLSVINWDMYTAGIIAVVSLFATIIFFIMLLGYLIVHLNNNTGAKYALIFVGILVIIFIIWEIIVHTPV